MNSRQVLLVSSLIVILFLSSAELYVTIFAAPSGGEWTSFTHDLSDSRYNSASTITGSNVNNITQKWIFSTSTAVTSTPIVSNGVVYFADWGGNVHAVNINTHAQIWSKNLGHAISSTVLVDPAKNMLIVGLGPVGNVRPTVYALSTANGHTMWTSHFNTSMNTIFASPVLFNGMIYIGVASNDAGESNASKIGELVALSETTGNQVWNFSTMVGTSGGAAVWGTAVVDSTLNAVYFATGNAYASTSGTQLYSYSIISLNALSGSRNWHYQAYTNRATGGDNDFGSSANLFSVSISGATHKAVGIAEKGGNYYLLDRTSGALLRKTTIGTGTVAVGGFINSGSNPEVFIPANPNIIAYFPGTNTYAWKVVAPSHMTGSVAIVPGAVFYSAGKNLYALSTSTGAQLFNATLTGGILGGISVAEGYVLVPFGGANPTSGSSHCPCGVVAFSPN